MSGVTSYRRWSGSCRMDESATLATAFEAIDEE